MKFLLTIIIFICANTLFAQKPAIDSNAYKAWSSLGASTISKNGHYVFYTVENAPIGSNTLVVQSTNTKWKKEFKGEIKEGQSFVTDKYFIFVNNNDSLGILTLGSNFIEYFPKVSSLRHIKTNYDEFLAYTFKNKPSVLILRNLISNKERAFTDVDRWDFDTNVLVLFKLVKGNNRRQSINLIDIKSGKASKIWEGFKMEELVMDLKHRQMAFKTGDSVWYCKLNNYDVPVCILHSTSNGVEQGMKLGYLNSFSKDGKFLFTSLIEKRDIKPQERTVEVWSYKDMILPSEREDGFIDQRYMSVINISERKIIRLQQYSSQEFQFGNSKTAPDTVALVGNNQAANEAWSIAYNSSYNLISIKNGIMKPLHFLNKLLPGTVKLSLHGKYIIYYDIIDQTYCSYEIATGKIRNLIKGLKVAWTNVNNDDVPNALQAGRGVGGWIRNDEFVLIYDRYDIWKLDPLNIKEPVNLTNGFGEKHKIVFNLASKNANKEGIEKAAKIYLAAFNTETKESGYFLKQLDKPGNPKLLNMGPYLFDSNSPYVPDKDLDFDPVRAENADVYIVKRRSANDAPNYFITKDFTNFTRLSDLQPQKEYNWYSTELHKWKSLDGRALQGVLYKPDNFDPKKKYPIIFHYYERKSDGLNSYIKPEPLCGGCNIDIPTYVSNGYLVFTLDIYYKVGDPMQGTYDAVVSAANYVSILPFVNAKKIGLQGCSWGGYQTNYLVTHSNLFAAAVSSSGVADWISVYGSVYGNSQQVMYETGQLRVGASLWEKTDVYIKNSSILNVHKVTTPILMMHTKKDERCPYFDALAFFTGLRRMGKKAWMLAYSEGNHGIGGKEADDFSIRLMQFFDHYLKEKPAPLWMIESVSAENRSWKAGQELDSQGRTPGPGILTPTEQAKVDSLMIRKPIKVTLK